MFSDKNVVTCSRRQNGHQKVDAYSLWIPQSFANNREFNMNEGYLDSNFYFQFEIPTT